MARQQFNNPRDAATELILRHSPLNPDDGSQPNGRHAQYNAAERDAWAQVERVGAGTEEGKFWLFTVKLITEEYHERPVPDAEAQHDETHDGALALG